MKNRVVRPRARRVRKGVARLFVLGAALAAAGIPGHAFAQQSSAPKAVAGADVTAFAIEPDQLGTVMAHFERLTGLRVVFAESALAMIPSMGVAGTLTPSQALDRLLAGTSVAARISGGVITLDVAGVSEFVAVTGDGAAKATSPKYTEPLRDTPQTLVVIPQSVFEEQGATSLRDALRNTPGITLAAGEGGTAPGDNLLIRGFSARNDVYVDGARDPGVVSRDTFNTESVEVAKGPSSVTTGRGSTGGSVNLVTKAATLQDHADIRLTGGTAAHRRATLDVNRRVSESTALRLNGMWQDAGVPRRDAVTQKAWGFAPTVGFGIGQPTTVTVGYQHVHQDNVPDHGLPSTLPAAAVAAGITVADLDFRNFYGLVSRDREKTDSDLATVTIEHRISGELSLRNLTRYGRNSLDRVVTSPRAATALNASADPGFDAALAQIRRSDTKYQFRDDRTIANQTDLTATFATGEINHAVVAGLEFAHDRQPAYAVTDAFADGRPPVTDLFNPTPDDAYVPTLSRTGAASKANATSGAVYAFDTLKFSERWQLDIGARLDRVEVDYVTTATSGAVSEFGRVDTALSGRSGVVYKPLRRGSVYAAYSTSFTPSFDGSFGLTLTASGTNAAALPPERSHNVEVGTKWDVTPTLFVTAAAFRTEKTNAKTTDASGATVLAGDQLVTGVEFGVSGRVTSRWSVFSGLSLMDGTVRESAVPAEVGRRLAYVPETSFNVWSTYDLPIRLTLGAGAQFTDGYFFNNTNALTTANQAAIQAMTKYWLFNAVATWELNDHMSLQINGGNLANRRYVERANQGHFVPGPGRSVLVTPVITF